ncbi:MAG: magnesium transporter [Leptonema illini]|jgi:magnesium transporter|uniref:Magnesium transporter MgtE n=2 Tax=Leptonema illini TaxID=183 RepID=H2CIH3_9LEPT|nr:magnesium transporter [Leptonema illini]EHQ05966.1 magnesium transporter [Leptonema illini DSM 21528]KAB2931376.1 MAG: magnesium transporter [Leptonema illini]
MAEFREKEETEEPARLLDPERLSFTRDDPEWEDHLRALLARSDDSELKSFVSDLYTSDIAHFFEKLSFEESDRLFKLLDPEEQGLLLLELDDNIKERFLDHLSHEELATIVGEQQSDTAADILGELDDEQRGRILSRLDPDDRFEVSELLGYPEGTAGSIMAREFVSVLETDTVKKAIANVRRISRETDDIYNVFVVDKAGRYRGHISLRRLILTRPSTRVKKIMEEELLPLPATMDVEEVANSFTRYDFITAPVVDERGVLIGRITADDILEVMQDEASEDFLRMGGVSAEETLKTPVWRAAAVRVLWLTINLATAFLAASIVRFFEDTIEKVVILAALMPIVAGMGGNAASQTMAFTIRNLALGEISKQGSRRVVFREMGIGLINGLSLGIFAGLLVFMLTHHVILSGLISFALFGNMLIAAAIGSSVPILLQKWNIDPAIGSSIFVTTCTDMGGFFFLLGMARLLLPFLLSGIQ